MRHRHQEGPNVRLLRVGETIRHALSTILTRDTMQDPALSGVPVTVSEVRVSPNLRDATVFILPLGGDNQDEVVEALQGAAPYLRGQLGRAIRLKYMPQLHFDLDRSFDQASHVEDLLADPHVRQDLNEQGPDEQGPDENGTKSGTESGTESGKEEA